MNGDDGAQGKFDRLGLHRHFGDVEKQGRVLFATSMSVRSKRVKSIRMGFLLLSTLGCPRGESRRVIERVADQHRHRSEKVRSMTETKEFAPDISPMEIVRWAKEAELDQASERDFLERVWKG